MTFQPPHFASCRYKREKKRLWNYTEDKIEQQAIIAEKEIAIAIANL